MIGWVIIAVVLAWISGYMFRAVGEVERWARRRGR